MLSYFEISVSPVLDQQKPTIEKLVWYRNSIAHGENSITVTQEDVETFISCITKCIDEMLSLFSMYISSLNYCKKIAKKGQDYFLPLFIKKQSLAAFSTARTAAPIGRHSP